LELLYGIWSCWIYRYDNNNVGEMGFGLNGGRVWVVEGG
jgi:hypothetical protein